VALCLPAGSALAAPGDLDPTFGNGGKSTLNIGGGAFAVNLLLQPDGKPIITGTVGTDLFAARVLTPQGTLDPSYGLGSGFSRVDFGAGERGGAAALQPDGKIVLGGTTDAIGDDYGVARLLNPQGTFDGSYGINGFRAGVLNPGDVLNGLALQPDGKIVFAGSWGGPPPNGDDWLIGRLLNPQGTPDTSFDGDGFVRLSFGGTADAASDVLVQPDGRILVAGASRNQGGGFDFGAVKRVLPGGGSDDSFGNTSDVRGLGAAVFTLALQPDGKILAGGFTGLGSTITRLLPNGARDESFGGDGSTGTADISSASDILVQPDGKVVALGSIGTSIGVVRFQPNGLVDTTFGTGGKTIIPLGGDTGMAAAGGVVQQADGKIIVVGDLLSNITLARLEGDPPGNVAGKCRGKEATILGTNAKDKLKGTNKKDVISAGGAKDTVKGLKGNDLICGGKGPDKLIGGPGKDTLSGEKGKDKLFGGPKKDTLIGGAAKDLLVGGGGPAKIKGGPGKDTERQ